jgi:Protein of unknown function (DUF3108)
MKSIKKNVLLFCLLLTASTLSKGQNEFCGIKNTSFQAGERLVYTVYYNMGFIWVNAGNAEFEISSEQYNGKDVYHITGKGKTARSYEWFYKVRDRYESIIDKETLLPLHFIRKVNEGGFKIDNDVVFDHEKKQAISNNKTFSMPRCTQDVLSAIYYARNINYNKYKPGDTIPFDMFLDDKVYNLYIRYVGKEKLTTRSGTYNAIKIAPLLIEGTMFKGGEKMMVWVTDDENHLPLRVDSPILVGSIKCDLVEYKNLRNPFGGLTNN